MKYLLILLACCTISARAQLKGKPCEGCEAAFEYGAKKLKPVDTLPDFNRPGPKLKVTGIIYQRDGTSPAKNVILYIYHTNQAGRYARKGNESGWGIRHVHRLPHLYHHDLPAKARYERASTEFIGTRQGKIAGRM